jgi:hypothetical protein
MIACEKGHLANRGTRWPSILPRADNVGSAAARLADRAGPLHYLTH